MTLRSKVIAIVTGVVVLGVAVASLTAFDSTGRELRSETDEFLAIRASEVANGLRTPPQPRPNEPDLEENDRDGDGNRRGNRGDSAFDPDAIAQTIDANGNIIASEGGVLPVSERDENIAAGESRAKYRYVVIDDEKFRMLTAPTPDGGAVQVAQSVESTDKVLGRLASRLAIYGLVLAALAAVLGWLLMRRTTRPLADLTAATERVAATRDLTPIGLSGDDEVGRLALSFDKMLEALRRSRAQQQRLVQDAGHELRTPLTSLRANVEFLQRADGLPADQRAEILIGVQSELAELGTLVDEVVVLATDESAAEVAMAEVDLGAIVADAVATFERRTGRTVSVSSERTVINGNSALLDRAVTNLLGNAHKFSNADRPVELTLVDRRVIVRDHGDGIPADDLDQIFERFHRSDAARALPGSGLGLAIVRHVAEQHGGDASARNHPDGGAEVSFTVADSGRRAPG